MGDAVIKAEGIGKSYLIGHQSKERYVALRDVIANKTRGLWSKIRGLESRIHKDIEEFWALKDVSFEVKQGDRIGIIGRNGAGKSTLLKILSRITEPTKGKVSIKGRVASLLEVGTGFHPELTGRENIYLNGAILGMTRREIKAKFDEIVDFAEVEKFLDTPVKHFSSGMYVRLAFAVAAHLEPEILLVDEVLAVGDIAFQKKCLGKMEDVSVKEGRTVLYVSHNLATVNSLCKKGMLLEKGLLIFSGEAPLVVNRYSERMRDLKDMRNEDLKVKSNCIKFISGRILNNAGEVISAVKLNEEFIIEMEYHVGEEVSGICVPNFDFKTADGMYVFCVNAPDMKPLAAGTYKAVCKVPGNFLNDGVYTIGLAVTEYIKNSLFVHFHEQHYLTITVIDSILDNPLRYGYGGFIPGVLRPVFEWDVAKSDKGYGKNIC